MEHPASNPTHPHAPPALAKLAACVPGTLFQYESTPRGTGRFTFISQGAEDLCGIAATDILQQPERAFDTIHPDDRTAFLRSGARARRSLATWHHGFRIRRTDGTTRHIRAQAEPEATPDGSVLWNGYLHDDTDQHEAKQALAHAKERAEAASNAKTDFLANMSHEIRTPMTAILGYAEQIADDPDCRDDPETINEAADTIRNNAKHMLSILNDILDVSKIEAGQFDVELIHADPAALLRDIQTLLAPKAAAKSLELRVENEGPLPERILTDPVRLRQILLNLAGNAIKFTERGAVRVVASFERRTWLLTIRISDTGPGMPPEQLERIRKFDPFTQADRSTARRFGGTGLGLHISNALAILLGGSLAVESTPGKGTRFTLNIGTGDPEEGPASAHTNHNPTAPTTNPNTTPTQAAPKPPLHGLAILLVEDSNDIQRLIAHHLTKAGAAVTAADNGRAAIDTVNAATPEKTPDLILMDIQMPVLDGYDATRALRNAGHTMPIIALTAHAMAGDRQKTLDAGCDDYLTKPIDAPALIKTCARHARNTTRTTPNSPEHDRAA